MNPWTLQFINAVGSPQTVTFAQFAALEGGKIIADAWQVQFVSHKASTVTLASARRATEPGARNSFRIADFNHRPHRHGRFRGIELIARAPLTRAGPVHPISSKTPGIFSTTALFTSNGTALRRPEPPALCPSNGLCCTSPIRARSTRPRRSTASLPPASRSWIF